MINNSLCSNKRNSRNKMSWKTICANSGNIDKDKELSVSVKIQIKNLLICLYHYYYFGDVFWKSFLQNLICLPKEQEKSHYFWKKNVLFASVLISQNRQVSTVQKCSRVVMQGCTGILWLPVKSPSSQHNIIWDFWLCHLAVGKSWAFGKSKWLIWLSGLGTGMEFPNPRALSVCPL